MSALLDDKILIFLLSGTAFVWAISVIGSIISYKVYYKRRYGKPCPLPIKSFSYKESSIEQEIQKIEFRDPVGFWLKFWIAITYLSILAGIFIVLSTLFKSLNQV